MINTYAKIEGNLVSNIIVCEDSQISALNGDYVKVTSETNTPVQGYAYNSEKNKFESPSPHPSWILKEDLTWESPIGPKPAGIVRWDEENQEWDIIVPAE
jgi:hypothetical protein